MYPHRINLREPWTAIPHQQSTTFRRAFRWPTELMPFEQLWLVIGWADLPIQVTLNKQLVGSQQDTGVPLQLNITSFIQNQNLLEVTCSRVGDSVKAQGKISSVFLEVRRSVHLSTLTGNCRWNVGKPLFELAATIAGQVERQLSLVIRLNDKEIHYGDLARVDVPIIVTSETLDVPKWMPWQTNELQNLEIQLLDPACVLSQHHYQTGFVDTVLAANLPIDDYPSQEPILESAWLERADRQGRLVRLQDVPLAARLQYLWHHPCLKHRC